MDPVDPAVMRQPPRKKDAAIITKRLIQRILFSAAIIVAGTLFVYMFALDDDKMSRREQTMVSSPLFLPLGTGTSAYRRRTQTFTCFVFLDLTSAIQNRSLSCPLDGNKMLITTVSISFLTQLALVYVPFMQSVFQTEALRTRDLGLLLGLAGCSFAMHEMRRRYERVINANAGVGGLGGGGGVDRVV